VSVEILHQLCKQYLSKVKKLNNDQMYNVCKCPMHNQQTRANVPAPQLVHHHRRSFIVEEFKNLIIGIVTLTFKSLTC